LHAARLLDRLGGGAAPYQDVEQVRADFEATHDLPTELDPNSRLAYPIVFALVFLGKFFISLLIYSSLATLFSLTPIDELERPSRWDRFRPAIMILGFIVPIWIVWAAATRGGLVGPALGVALLGPDGRPPSRLRCAGREAAIWIPFVLLTTTVDWLPALGLGPHPRILGLGVAAALLLADAAHGWSFGGRLLHDRLSRVYVVPK
jgi:hypothetical protein